MTSQQSALVLGNGLPTNVKENLMMGRLQSVNALGDVTQIELAFDNAFSQLRTLSAKVDDLGKSSARTPEKERAPEEKRAVRDHETEVGD